MSVPTDAAGDLIERAKGMPPVTVGELLAPAGALLVVAPHPDDETLGCGAAISAALASGRRVIVVLLTNGENSHPRSRTYPPDVLAALRRQEMAGALEALTAKSGAEAPSVHALHLPDGGVPTAGPNAERAVGAIATIARLASVRTIWCTWRGDPHCDHAAAAALSDRVEEAMSGRSSHSVLRRDYAVWGRFGAVLPGEDRLLVLPPGAHAAAKAEAMDRYRSQLTPMIDDDPDGFVMPPKLVRHFAIAPELFIDERRR